MNSQKMQRANQINQFFIYIPQKLEIKKEYNRCCTAGFTRQQQKLLSTSISVKKDRHCFSARTHRNNSPAAVKSVKELFGELGQVSNPQQFDNIQQPMKQKLNNLKSLIYQRAAALDKISQKMKSVYLIQRQQIKSARPIVLHSKSSRRQLLQLKSAKIRNTEDTNTTFNRIGPTHKLKSFENNSNHIYEFTQQIILKGGKINSQNMHTARKNQIESCEKKGYTARRMANQSQIKKTASQLYNEEDYRPWETLRPDGLDDE